jgi:hypothetical protein
MSRESQPLAVIAARGLSERKTGFAGNDSAISISKCTTALQTPSSWKAHAVDLLSEVFEIELTLASAWAHAIQARFSFFREV